MPGPIGPSSARTSSRSRTLRVAGPPRSAARTSLAVSANRPNARASSTQPATITPQAIRPPLLPFVASVTWSSSLAWMMNALPTAPTVVSKRVVGPFGQRDPVGGGIEVGDAVRVDDEVRQVARMGAGRVLEPVLPGERVVVAAGRREGRAARADAVDVDAVEARRQTLDVDVDVDDRRCASSTSLAQPIVGATRHRRSVALACAAPPATDWPANAPARASAAPSDSDREDDSPDGGHGSPPTLAT